MIEGSTGTKNSKETALADHLLYTKPLDCSDPITEVLTLAKNLVRPHKTGNTCVSPTSDITDHYHSGAGNIQHSMTSCRMTMSSDSIVDNRIRLGSGFITRT